MKNLLKLYFLGLIILCFGCSYGMASDIKVDTSNTITYYFGVEINDVLCGYAETMVSPMIIDGQDMTMISGEVHVLLSLMGEGMDMDFQYEYQCTNDLTSYLYSKVDIMVGTTEINYSTRVEGGIAYYESNLNAKPKTVKLPEGVILETPLTYPHLVNDFSGKELNEKTYLVYDESKGEITEKKYRLTGAEEIEILGEKRSTLIFEEINLNTGAKVKFWMGPEDGICYKAIFQGGRVVYLSDRSVKKKITTGNLNELLFAGVDLIINDVPGIAYMKVDAEIESAGEWLTAESLNYPGQTFTGTVTENLIEGLFEMEYTRYDGTNAPSFPFDYSNDTSLLKYLEAEYLIESDHPVLIKKAQEITEGASDSWEAAKSLSTWVAYNIHGAIPGGTSAIKTYETRSGECGSHSRLLAAFCRSVGIPARMVVGCMYINYYGGSFGQHAWNEVYMGDEGWISVDATAFEIDFIDCGHIKLGENTTFNPVEMKILEYKLMDSDLEIIDVFIPEKYKRYTGAYSNPERGTVMQVKFLDEELGVEIPNQVTLALNDPGDDNLWYAKLSDKIFFKFIEDGYGNITSMILTEIIPVPRKNEPVEIADTIPESLKPYLGTFHSMQLQSDFRIIYQNNTIAVDDPKANMIIEMQPPDESGLWNDEFGKHAIRFDKNEKGEVTAMNIYSRVELKRN